MVNVPPKLGLIVCLSALGCFPGKVVGTSDATSIGDSTSADSTTSDAESTSSEPSESSTGDGDGDPGPSETGEDTGEDTNTTVFVAETDFATCSVCDEIAQDCPEGEKCTPGDYRGSCGPPSCKPIVGDLPPGEACTIVDGVDDCDASSWCYPGQIGLDGPHECIEFCQGTHDDPSCSSPDQVCVADRTIYEGPLGCRPRCNPLMPEGCLAVEMCTVAWNDQADFGCVPDGAELAVGEPCKDNQECIAGLCVSAPNLPECADTRCCASFCDLLAPDCPVATECVPIELADNPESTVGVCRLPD